jgi:S1-C subfamily serine protease
VLPGSPAAAAGIRVFDRVYEVNGRRFSSSDEFGKLLQTDDKPLKLLTETSGRMRTAEITPFTLLFPATEMFPKIAPSDAGER